MKRLVIINLVLIITALYFAMNFGEEQGSVMTGYVVYYNTTELQTMRSFKQPLVNRTLLFSKGGFRLNESLLVKIESKNVYGDADGEGKDCYYTSYLQTKYFYDKNGNKVRDADEPIVYGVSTNNDGCVVADIPEDFSLAQTLTT